MKILSIVGARPQFIKSAMVSETIRLHNALGRKPRIRHRLLHTGQHYERTLSDVFFEQLPLPKPHYSLNVGSGHHGAQTAAMLERIEGVLLRERPNVVLVYGDTNSTIAGALATAKLHIPLAHIEAGLRSFNRLMPEELNRIVTDHLSNLLLCPTATAVENLKHEGIQRGVFFTGDVMLDAVQGFASLAERRSRALRDLGLRSQNYVLVTIHRAENTDSPERLGQIVELLANLDQPAIFPMHPRVRNRLGRSRQGRMLGRALEKVTRLQVVDPVSYLDMLLLEKHARVIMTDSGGVQKEAYFLGVPCLTLREETEWVETTTGGWNHVAGTSPEKILPLFNSLWSGNGQAPRGYPDLAKFGSAHAAREVLQVLTQNIS